MLLDLYTVFPGGRYGGLVFPSLRILQSLLWSTQSKGLGSWQSSRCMRLWYIILFISFWIQFANILLRIFASMFIEILFCVCFLVLYLFCFAVRYTVLIEKIRNAIYFWCILALTVRYFMLIAGTCKFFPLSLSLFFFFKAQELQIISFTYLYFFQLI